MANYPPPSENLPIFDNDVFVNLNDPVTIDYANKHYLKYPNAQGTENLLTTNVNGVLTTNSDVVFSPNTQIQWDPTDANYLINNASLPKSITVGTHNVALGNNALHDITGGNDNVALGFRSLAVLNTGNDNICLGRRTGEKINSDFGFIAIGGGALSNHQGITGGIPNIAIGYDSQADAVSTTQNISIGTDSLHLNKFGNKNVAIGHGCLRDLNSANTDDNVSIGYQSNMTQTQGQRNVAIGSGSNNAGFSSSVALGYQSTNTASNQVRLGRASETVSCPGTLTFKTISDNTNTTCYIPFSKTTAGTEGSLYVDDTTGPLSYNPSTSTLTCAYTTLSQGVVNPDITNKNYVWTDRTTRPSGTGDILIGYQAGNTLSTGASSVMIGTNAGRQTSSGNNNVFIGQQVAEGTNASNCTFIGYLSNQVNAAGSNCTSVGSNTSCATYQTSTALGYGATCTSNNQIRLGTASETVSCPGNLTFKTISDNTSGTYYIPFSKTAAGTEGSLYIDDTTGPLTYNPSTSTLTCAIYDGPTATTDVRFGNSITTGNIYIGYNAGAGVNCHIVPNGAFTGTCYVFGGSVNATMFIRGNLKMQYGIRTTTTTYTLTSEMLGYTTSKTTGWPSPATFGDTATNINSITIDGSTIAYGIYRIDVYLNYSSDIDNTIQLGVSTTSATFQNPSINKYSPAGKNDGIYFSKTISAYTNTTFYIVADGSAGSTTTLDTSGTDGCNITLTRL